MMSEMKKYKEYYSQIKLDNNAAEKIRGDMHSARYKKNNLPNLYKFNRYAAVLSCMLVLVTALDSIGGRTYTLPMYIVEDITQETRIDETETEVLTNNKVTEPQQDSEEESYITTTIPDEDSFTELVTVVPSIDDDNGSIGSNSDDDADFHQEDNQTAIRDETTRKPIGNTGTSRTTTPTTKPTENTGTSRITTPTTKPTENTEATRETTTAQPPQTTVTNVQTTIVTVDQSESETVRTTHRETTVVEVTTIVEVTAEPEETISEVINQYYIYVHVEVEKSTNNNLSKVIDENTYTGIGKYSIVRWDILKDNDSNYMLQFVLVLSSPNLFNTSSATLWIKNNPIKGQVFVFYSN